MSSLFKELITKHDGVGFACVLASKLRKAGVFSRVDDSTASIGKRYSRNDELGTPYGVTIDFASR